MAAGSYEITGLTAGKAYVVSCRPKSGGAWIADKATYSQDEYAIATDPFTTPYLFKATSVNSGDEYWDSVALSFNCDGTNGSTDLSSADAVGHTVTGSGDVQYSTAQSKFGGSSIAFDGTGDFLTVADNADLTVANSESMTFEFWAYVSSVAANGAFFTIANGATTWLFQCYVRTDRKVTFVRYAGMSLTTTATITLDTWHHIAIVRNSTVWTVYIDGVASATTTDNVAIDPYSILIGANNSALPWPLTGYLDDIRFTIGVARYTSAFTPPTEAFIQGLGVPTGSTEPTWPTTPGDTVVDGGVTWTNMGQMVQPLMQGPLIAA